MGTSPTISLQRYTVKSKDPRTGLSVVKDTVSGQLYYMNQLVFTSPQNLAQQASKFRNKTYIRHQYFLNLLQVIETSQKSFCSQFHKLSLIYDYASHSLEDEIIARAKIKEFFHEKQLFSVAFSIVSCLNFFFSKGISHGNLSTQSIYVDNQGKIKVADPGFAINFPSKLYSPEGLKGQIVGLAGISKSDVYVLGMTMLKSSLLQNIQDCYDFPLGSVRDEFQTLLLNKVASKYSQQWTKFLRSCLTKSHLQRPSFEMLQRQLTRSAQRLSGSINSNYRMSQQIPQFKRFYEEESDCNSMIQIVDGQSGGKIPLKNYTAKNLTPAKSNVRTVRKSKNQRDEKPALSPLKSEILQDNSIGRKPQAQHLDNLIPLRTSHVTHKPAPTYNEPPRQLIQQHSHYLPQTENYIRPKNQTSFQPRLQIRPLHILKPIQLQKQFSAPIVKPTPYFSNQHSNQNLNFLNQFPHSEFLVRQSTFNPKPIPQQNFKREQMSRPPLLGQVQFKNQEQRGFVSNHFQRKVQSNQMRMQLPLKPQSHQVSAALSPKMNYVQINPYQPLTFTNYELSVKQPQQPPQFTKPPQTLKKIEVFQPLQRTTPAHPQDNSGFPQQRQPDLRMQVLPLNKSIITKQSLQLKSQNYSPISSLAVQKKELNLPLQIIDLPRAKHHRFENILQTTITSDSKPHSSNLLESVPKKQLQVIQQSFEESTVKKQECNIVVEENEPSFYNSKSESQELFKSQVTETIQENKVFQEITNQINQNYSKANNRKKLMSQFQQSFGIQNNFLQDKIKTTRILKTAKKLPNFKADSWDTPASRDFPDAKVQQCQIDENQEVQQSQLFNRESYQMSMPAETDRSNASLNEFCNTNKPSYVVQEYHDGARYQGWKVKGKRQGLGKFYYKDGGLYCGQWYQDMMNGKGILYYCNGQPAYDGQWKQDMFDGFGILYNESPQPFDQEFDYSDMNSVNNIWVKYEGQFKNDIKEGRGKLTLSNGEIFQGKFAQDDINGRGRYLTLQGDYVQGFWRQNVLVNE